MDDEDPAVQANAIEIIERYWAVEQEREWSWIGTVKKPLLKLARARCRQRMQQLSERRCDWQDREGLLYLVSEVIFLCGQ